MQNILSVLFRERDWHAQPEEQPLEDQEWAITAGRDPQSLRQHLVWQLTEMLDTDSSEDFEKISILDVKDFSDQILIQDQEKALESELDSQEDLVFWSDDSYLDNERNEAEIIWQKNTKKWQNQKLTLK